MPKIEPNRQDRSHVVIITPVFGGNGSGASVYYQLLAGELIKKGFRVTIISDSEKSSSKLPVAHVPLFPARCSRNKRPLMDLLLYAWQNIKYFHLFKLLRNLKPDKVLVHSSFYNNYGTFSFVANSLLKLNPTVSFIADIRDSLIPPKKVECLNEYKRIVVCSENIKAHLYAHGAEITKVSLVPVIQEQISINQVLANDLLAKYRIHRPYIFYGGLVKESKGVDLLLEAFLKHIRPTRNISLVISGLLKSSQHKLRSMLNEEGVQYIGNQSRQNVLALIDNAALCVNLSSAEGLPRASLEAIALKRPTVLPPNIPEFENHCTDNIAHQLDAPSAASKMLQILDSKVSPPYPIEIHYPENVVEQYLEILKS